MKFEDIRKYVKQVLTNSFTNKTTIDKLSESDDGTLLFDGEEIKGGSGGIEIGPNEPSEDDIVLFIDTDENYDYVDNITANEIKLATQGADNGKIRFGIDQNGNYGYYKVGADSVTPFNIFPVEVSSLTTEGTLKFVTDYYPTPNTVIEYSFKQLEISPFQQRFFGADFHTSGKPSIQCYINGGGYFAYSLNNSGATWASTGLKIAALTNYTLKMDIANRKLYINNNTYNLSSGSALTINSTQPLSFCASTVDSNTKGNRAVFYYAKIYEGETLKRWYVPAITRIGEFTLYDKITNSYTETRSIAL